MKTWVEFYKDRVTEEYLNHVITKYSYFVNLIHSEINSTDDIIVELGCGICNITRTLAELNPGAKFIAMDNDEEMLKLSADNLAAGNLTNIPLLRGNILNYNQIPFGTIAHSHGVLEHFTDGEIKQIINIQKLKFEKLFHYVPSAKYEKPSFGDERLLTEYEWYNICKPDEIYSFNDDYDLILSWRK